MKRWLLALALILFSAPAFAQNTQCSDRPNGDNTNACANTRFVHNSVTAAVPSVTIESQGGGCSATVPDNTAALLSAVSSVSGAVRVLFTQNCTYNFTQTNAITFSKNGVFLEGAGQFSTTLNYSGSSDGTFLKWSNGLSSMAWGGISKLYLFSSDTTHSKVMAEWFDLSTFYVDEVYCTGPAPTGQLRGGASKSACLYSHGRDHANIHKFNGVAELPIRIGMNPHYYLSTDHYHFTDVYPIGDLLTGTNSLITVDPGVVVTNLTIDGAEPWPGGTHGFYLNDTSATHFVFAITAAGSGYTAGVPLTVSGGTCSTPITITPLTVNGSGAILTAAITNPGVCSVTPSNPVAVTSGAATFTIGYVASFGLSFSNVRTEQGVSPTSYTFYIAPIALQSLTIHNSIMDSSRCGVFLKNVIFPTISDSTYLSGGCNKAVDATSANANDSLVYINNFWDVGVTHNVTGLTKIQGSASPTGTSVTVPPSALYTVATTGNTYTNPVFSGIASGAATIPNSVLVNSATTVNSQTCTLGAACTVTAAASSVAIGSTTITGGTTLRVLYDNAGVLGEYTNTQLTALINPATATLSGALPAWPNDTTKFFRGDGTYTTIPASSIVSGAALTKTDDTNVTLTLGGAPTTALLSATSLTLGWTGQLGLTRGGTAASLTASNGGVVYSTASALAILSGTATARQMLQSGAITTPAWSTTTWPATTTINRLLWSSAANVISDLATANSSILVTDSGGIPSLSTTLPAHTLAGTISGGGNQINNVIIGTSTPLAGFFTTLSASTSVTSPLVIGGSGTTGTQLTFKTTTGNGTTDQFSFTGGNNGATSFGILSGSGLVVGSTTSTLGTSLIGAATPFAGASTSAIIAGLRYSSPGAIGAQASLVSSRGAAPGTMGAVQAGDGLGGFIFGGDNGVTYIQRGATIRASVVTNWTSSLNDAQLVFAVTATGGNAPTDAMTINQSGGLSMNVAGTAIADPGNGNIAATRYFSGTTGGLASKVCTINTANAATGITMTITGGIVTGTTTC